MRNLITSRSRLDWDSREPDQVSGSSLTWRSGTGATEVFFYGYGRCLKAFVAVLLLIITPRSRQGHLGRSSRALGHTDMACGHVPRLRSFGRTPITACTPGRRGTSEASGSESCRRNNANCLDQLHFNDDLPPERILGTTRSFMTIRPASLRNILQFEYDV